jgi:hypothetical protein
MSEEPYDFMVLPFVEIELRLGTISRNKFDPNVDKKYFEKIKENLESGDWKTTINKNTIEYVRSSNGQNMKLITEGDTEKLILKENVFNEDTQLNSSPFDIRYSMNQEFKLDSQIGTFSKNECLIRNKSRKSFVSDNFQYDLTVVNENNSGITKTKYEIEIELLVNKETLTWKTCYVNDFLECKVYDLINIVEKLPRDKFKINIAKNK